MADTIEPLPSIRRDTTLELTDRGGQLGQLYVVDTENHVIRQVDPGSGHVSTVAGTGEQESSGDGGPARQAQLSRPHGICVGGDGELFIGDTLNHRVRRVRP